MRVPSEEEAAKRGVVPPMRDAMKRFGEAIYGEEGFQAVQEAAAHQIEAQAREARRLQRREALTTVLLVSATIMGIAWTALMIVAIIYLIDRL